MNAPGPRTHFGLPNYIKRKVLLVGDGAVGKTSVIRRFVVDNFADEYIATIGAKVTKKEMRVERGMTDYDVSMMIWDVLGQKGFNAIQSNSFMGSRGVVLVFDTTRPHTAESLRDYWVPMLQKVSPNAPRVIFANKVDLLANKAVADELASDLAYDLGCRHYLTSAKTGENVESGFRFLAREMIGAAESDLKALSGISPLPIDANTVDVADRIMVDFCNDFGGIETGSPILKEQFSRAGFDLKNPTMDGLLKAIDQLAEVERSFMSIPQVEERKARWIGWVKEIKKP